MPPVVRNFGTHRDGSTVEAARISAHGPTIEVMTHGASLMRLEPDGGRSLVLGFETYQDYLDRGRHFGAIVGRYANRIGGARAVIGGEVRLLDRNWRGQHLLHGGDDGTGGRNWRIAEAGEDSVALTDHLPDGHMGFPGGLDVRVTYRILPGPVLEIVIEAVTDAPTLCNFAQHGYFNLTGGDSIADHLLTIPAEAYTPVDADLIPTGAVEPVQHTRFDFRQPTRLGAQMARGLLDHNLCLATSRQPCRAVAHLTAPGASHALTICSTEPGLQIYDGTHLGHRGIALEPQLWPDAPNHPGFPDAGLAPGETYRQVTRFVISRPG
ncbi:aldose epimerase family protein [Paracoccus zhejiangensis]|uniref:Galactose mutarotase n=1 Tax=Paracoccus zhejiangensis TaxID=1077935 RepID=A0A2H5EUG0_9RHOB|nr:aldose epimerase family protein [Paracoccus zhejiangensis]AUH62930.1 galactose mutarotase [Paracoccus zhejiangensis]